MASCPHIRSFTFLGTQLGYQVGGPSLLALPPGLSLSPLEWPSRLVATSQPSTGAPVKQGAPPGCSAGLVSPHRPPESTPQMLTGTCYVLSLLLPGLRQAPLDWPLVPPAPSPQGAVSPADPAVLPQLQPVRAATSPGWPAWPVPSQTWPRPPCYASYSGTTLAPGGPLGSPEAPSNACTWLGLPLPRRAFCG